MDVEESIRGNPLDGVVLLMGCDKTTPSLLMGAASVDLPTIGVSGGPMLNGKWRGQEHRLGHRASGRMSEQVRAGTMTLEEFHEAESCMHRSPRPLHDDGHGVARWRAWSRRSASACPATPRIPAVDARRNVLARMAGRRIVDMVQEDLTLSKILTREAFENAIRDAGGDRRLDQRGRST